MSPQQHPQCRDNSNDPRSTLFCTRNFLSAVRRAGRPSTAALADGKAIFNSVHRGVSEMQHPHLCPYCGSDSLAPLISDRLFLAHIDGMEIPTVGLQAYHCPNGHAFLVIASEFRSKGIIAEQRGHALFV